MRRLLSLAAAALIATALPAPTAAVTPVRGIATYYAYHAGQAAAGPRLRAMLGSHWRGRYVTVRYGAKHIRVRLTDYCVCRSSVVIDLDTRDFNRLRPPAWLWGVARVTVA
jgi:hypothetical protein